MSELFLYLFYFLCGGLFLKTVIEPRLIFEYPYFLAGIFIIFLVPQTIILYNQPYLVPNSNLVPIFSMCFLCLGMGALGYYVAPLIKLGNNLNVPLNLHKLKIVGIIYMALGYFFLFLINREIGNSDEEVTQLSGSVTIYFMFFNVIYIAFPIFLYFSFRKPNFVNILLTVLSALPTLNLIIFAGRREPTALFVLSIALTMFYQRGFVPPRAAIIGIIVFAMLIIPAIGDYREKAEEDPWLALTSLDLQESFKNYFKVEENEVLELAVAAHVLDSYSFHGEYTFGASYWNEMVFRYVPGQLLGTDFKESLYIGERTVVYRNGYQRPPGLTITGLADSFQQFSYFGFIFFFFLGGFFRYLWRISQTEGNLLVQILYMLCVIQALLSVTHSTVVFLPGIFFSFIALWGAALYAKAETEE
ncbi:hypothetical protein AAE02nite_15930 [Adhaeribacter aerolatus]|uniref:Oligosaccharide repeat unit polymerase n=1 Tax=Adhaeribacter aerolatus TaxID=670289 RepID=A0A512AW25_9BACT|nr:hypothetical protein [Adhaeribacter aerolatus]GEO03929.1 hypothetical protein AAE02nite_15930 [Adhaeribacter aerolatus]